MADSGNKPPPLLTRINRWTRSLVGNIFSLDYYRLEGTLTAVENELSRKICEATGPKEDKPCWAVSAEMLLEASREALVQHRVDKGWKSLHAALRMEIFGYDDPELMTAAKTIRREAAKFGKWRRKAIFDLLGDPECKHDILDDFPPTFAAVYGSALIRDEAYHNQWVKIAVRKKTLFFLWWFNITSVLAIPLLSYWKILPEDLTNWKELVIVILAGFLGASLTTILTLTKKSISENIPDQVLGGVVTINRPVIGAAAALASYFLIKAGYFEMVFNIDKISLFQIITIAFVSGFSERFFVGAIGNITGEKK